jgi:hypothetical protein
MSIQDVLVLLQPESAPVPALMQHFGVQETQPTASAPLSEMISAGFSSIAQPGQVIGIAMA